MVKFHINSSYSHLLILLLGAVLLTNAIIVASYATVCPKCGTTPVPYPLSTRPDCGDPSYKVRCDSGTLLFETVNNTYPIISTQPQNQRFVIRPANFISNKTCITSDITSNGLQLNASLPFNVTSSNTIFYFNCTSLLLRSPLGCMTNNLCNSYVNESVCGSSGICCRFRAGGSTNSYSIRVRDAGCTAYRSFVNLDYSLPVSKWPAPGVEIHYLSPPEPLCRNQDDCDSDSTCNLADNNSTNGLRRCFCNSEFHWDPLLGSCAAGKQKNLGLKIAIASGVVGCSILLLMVLITYCRRRMITIYGSSLFSQDAPSYPKDVEALIKQNGSSIPKRFKYSTLKKITNSFKDEIGKGGYGNVYRGRLADGRVVAVKVLKEAKGNGEEFINEVASIGRTSHVNIVTLLGFCYERKRRALIYEFMPNGSLEKFIYGTTLSSEGQHLGWEKLYSISIGIARGLEYLHRGCNTRILHFDIKPHNILLDENFRPKISDFGLAKLYSTDESIISSLLQARGTIGYIAPEVTSRNFGKVSHKSDVYSYGMMILEMVGGRKNVNAGADHTSEIYYPRWLYNRIQSDDMLNLANGISEDENEIVRKMVIVGLWCIQIYPSERPSMSKVIELLEGQAASLEIPPRPYLCSVPSSPSDSKKKLVFSSSSATEHTSSA